MDAIRVGGGGRLEGANQKRRGCNEVAWIVIASSLMMMMLLLLLLKGTMVAVMAKGSPANAVDVRSKLKGAHSHLATRNHRGSSFPFEVDLDLEGWTAGTVR